MRLSVPIVLHRRNRYFLDVGMLAAHWFVTTSGDNCKSQALGVNGYWNVRAKISLFRYFQRVKPRGALCRRYDSLKILNRFGYRRGLFGCNCDACEQHKHELAAAVGLWGRVGLIGGLRRRL